MDNIADLIKKRQIKKSVKDCKTKGWQFEALEAIKKLKDGKINSGGIFRCFKINNNSAKNALLDSVELRKPYSRYFFKVFSEINKKQKNP